MPSRRIIKRENLNQNTRSRRGTQNNNFQSYDNQNRATTTYYTTGGADNTQNQYTYQDGPENRSDLLINSELVIYNSESQLAPAQGPNNLNLYQADEQNFQSNNNPNMADPNHIYPVTSSGTILTTNDGGENYVYVQQADGNNQNNNNNGQPRELGYVQYNSRNGSSNFNQMNGTLGGQDSNAQAQFINVNGLENTRTRLGESTSSHNSNGYISGANTKLTMESKKKMTNIYNQLQAQTQGNKTNITRFVTQNVVNDPYGSTYQSSGRLSAGISTRDHHDSGDLLQDNSGDRLGNNDGTSSSKRGSKKSEGKREVQNFIQKLASMLEKAADRENYPTYQTTDGTEPLIAWNGPDSFIIREPNKFTKDMVPAFFKSNKRESFIRQLNTYGFRKITNIENDNLMAENQHWEEVLHYTHSMFTQDNRENWINIRRRRADKREATDDMAGSPSVMGPEGGLNSSNLGNLNGKGSAGVTNDQMSAIMEELRKLNEHNQTVTEQMIKLSQDNDLLKQQNHQLFEREKRNKTNIANVVTLLSKLMKRKKYSNGTSGPEYPELMPTTSFNSADESHELRSGTRAITAGPSATNNKISDSVRNSENSPTASQVFNDITGMSSGIGTLQNNTNEDSLKSRKKTGNNRQHYNDNSIAINEGKGGSASAADDHYFKLEKVAKSPIVEMPSASPPSIKEILHDERELITQSNHAVYQNAKKRKAAITKVSTNNGTRKLRGESDSQGRIYEEPINSLRRRNIELQEESLQKIMPLAKQLSEQLSVRSEKIKADKAQKKSVKFRNNSQLVENIPKNSQNNNFNKKNPNKVHTTNISINLNELVGMSSGSNNNSMENDDSLILPNLTNVSNLDDTAFGHKKRTSKSSSLFQQENYTTESESEESACETITPKPRSSTRNSRNTRNNIDRKIQNVTDQRPDKAKFIKNNRTNHPSKIPKIIIENKLSHNKANQVENEKSKNKNSTVALNRGFSDWSFLGDFINEVSDQIDDGDLVQNLQENDYQEISSILSDGLD